MIRDKLMTLVLEIREEQHISPMEEDNIIEGYVKSAEYDINDVCGAKIDYEIDLKARSLLKNFVQYARYSRLAEFKQLYGGEYAYLQAKYYKPSNV